MLYVKLAFKKKLIKPILQTVTLIAETILINVRSRFMVEKPEHICDLTQELPMANFPVTDFHCNLYLYPSLTP